MMIDLLNKIHHGDCLEVMENLAQKGVKVDAIITDPPYGMTACDWDKIVSTKKMWDLFKKLRKKSANIVMFGKQPFTTLLNHSNIEEYRYEIIWQKQQATNPMCAKKRIMPIHENISIFYDQFGTYNPQIRMGFENYSSFQSSDKKTGEIYNSKSVHRNCSDGSRYPISVVNYPNIRGGLHPTQKPLKLIEWLVKTYTNEGEIVLDPFSGSGTTAIACDKLKRRFICIEKDKDYYEASVKRLEEHKKLLSKHNFKFLLEN